MKKVFLALVVMCAAMIGMTSCHTVSLDIITFVSQGVVEGFDAVSVSNDVMAIYRAEIAKAQGGVVESDFVVLRSQKDTKKAEEGALTGAEAAKPLALKKTYSVTPIVLLGEAKPYDVKLAEGAKDDCDFSIEITVGATQKIAVATHYFKIVK